MIEQVMDLREQTELTVAERAELGRYEAVIKRGLDTFVSVGNALLAIRRDKLYRATHATFEAYCEQRWQMTRDYAGKLIGAAEVVGNLNTIVSILPANEAQARPLTKLEPEQQVEAWQEAVESADGGRVTAAHVEKIVARFAEPKREPVAKVEPANYTPMRVLENMVAEWVAKHAREADHTEMAVLEFVVEKQTTRADTERRRLEDWLREQGCSWPNGIVGQVCVNLLATRRAAARQAANQAKAKVVYVEPDPARDPEYGPKPKLADDEMEVHPMAFTAILPPAPKVGAVFIDAGKTRRKLTPAEVEAVNDEIAKIREENAAATEPVQPPQAAQRLPFAPVAEGAMYDPRLFLSETLRLALTETQKMAQKHFGELTGRHSLLPAFDRAVADMLEPLNSLIAIPGGERADG